MRTKRTKPKKKPTINQRVDVAPEGGVLAVLGFYAEPVQKKVARWRSQLREDWIQDYFEQIATVIRFKGERMELHAAAPAHWPCVSDLFQAVTELYTDKAKPAFWLLTLPLSVATNGRFDKWPAIRQTIIENGGPCFEVATLTQAAKRLRLLTPPPMAQDYLATRPPLTPPYKVKVQLPRYDKMTRQNVIVNV